MAKSQSRIASIVGKHESDIVTEWVESLKASGGGKDSRISSSVLLQESKEFLALLQRGADADGLSDSNRKEWKEIEEFLVNMSRDRVKLGFSASETANFIFSLKRPLFAKIRAETGKSLETFADEITTASELIDQMGLLTTQAYQKSREDVIARQQEEMLELSTPVVKLWDGVLALPMIGTLDSARTQIVMESLLQRIVETGSELAIIDITGVPTVDTLVAQHLLKTVTAIRLMGADCIISGIRPQIAQTIVHLGVDLEGVTTKATLADALSLALKRAGLVVVKK